MIFIDEGTIALIVDRRTKSKYFTNMRVTFRKRRTLGLSFGEATGGKMNLIRFSHRRRSFCSTEMRRGEIYEENVKRENGKRVDVYKAFGENGLLHV